MPHILKIPEAGVIALHAASELASSGRPLSARELSERLAVSEAHLSKVMQRLVHSGLAISRRGPGGGFALNGEAAPTSLLDVLQAVIGPLEPTDCLLDRPVCNRPNCIFGDFFRDLDERLWKFLDETVLLPERKTQERSNDAAQKSH